MNPRNAKMKNDRSFLAIIWLFFLIVVPSAAAQSTAKDHFKEGEELLKQDQLFQAYDQFKLAVESGPSNKKYVKKLAETGNLASRAAQDQAHKFSTSDPGKCEQWLERASQYDTANESAARELASIRDEIRAARVKDEEAKQLLDKGEANTAQDLLISLRPFASAISDLGDLEKELQGVQIAKDAEINLKNHNYELAMREIDQAKGVASNCPFVLNVERKVRNADSDAILQDSKQFSSGSISDLIHVLRLTDNSLGVDENNDLAKRLKASTSQRLADLLLGTNSVNDSGQPENSPRVSLDG